MGAPKPVTVTNNGPALLTISGLTISGAHAQDFIASLQCPGGSVPPGASCDIQVQFAPKAIDSRTATLAIQDNAPNSPQTVPLTGFGFIIGPNQWAPTGSMNLRRRLHTATLLDNQKVLVAGGGDQPGTELYDPLTGTWTPTGAMSINRTGHTATKLNSGVVLVAGGGTSASAEVYNPITRRWTLTGSMSVPRAGHTATLLPGGRVLVAGGCNGAECPSAEVFDPAAGAWMPTASMHVARAFHTANLLSNGRVLVAGGDTPSAEVFDPFTGSWTTVGSLQVARTGHTATRLNNGKVLVAGGCSGDPCAFAELFDPTSGVWVAAARMRIPRVTHAATRLADGRVLVSGGTFFCDPEFGFCFTTRTGEVYNPVTDDWTRTGNMIAGRELHTLTLLPDGKALAAGGVDEGLFQLHGSAELFTPTETLAPAKR